MEYFAAVDKFVWLYIADTIVLIAILNALIIIQRTNHTKKLDFVFEFMSQLWNLIEIMFSEYEWKRISRKPITFVSILSLTFALVILILTVNLNAFVGMSFIVGSQSKVIDSLEQLAEDKHLIPICIGGTSLEDQLKVKNCHFY